VRGDGAAGLDTLSLERVREELLQRRFSVPGAKIRRVAPAYPRAMHVGTVYASTMASLTVCLACPILSGRS